MVGCGSFATLSHGPAQRRYASSHSDVILAGCCDSNPDRARDYREQFGYGHHYTDVAEMIAAERPDAAVVAVPPPLTCAVATSILARRVPLLLEKPPGLSLVELNRLCEAAEKGGVAVQVAFNRRHMPVMQRASAIIRSEFGAAFPGCVSYEMIRFGRWDPDFSTTAIHALDGALFLAGSPFHVVNLRFSHHRKGELEATDVSLEGESLSGTQVSITIQPVSGRNLETARIHAIDQYLVLTLPFSPKGRSEGKLEHWRRGKKIDAYSDHLFDFPERIGVYGETKAFMDAVRLGGAFSPLLQESHQQVALMEALRLRRSGTIALASHRGSLSEPPELQPASPKP
jgi:myo-inositol 2-dehydrogenase/D-chiro-inositol 1-dehydrogenase